MSTNMPGFQSFFQVVLHHFVLAKLATSSLRVNQNCKAILAAVGVDWLNYFGNIFQMNASLRNYLKEKCSSEFIYADNLQL